MKKVLSYQPSQFDFSYMAPDDKDVDQYLTPEEKRVGMHYLLVMPIFMWFLVIGFIFFNTNYQPFPYQVEEQNKSTQHGIGGGPPTAIPTNKPAITPPHLLEYEQYYGDELSAFGN